MLDKAHIGKSLNTVTTVVANGPLRFFAKAIGETQPVYTDESAARETGHRGLPAPPTYLFCLEMMDDPEPTRWMTDIGIDIHHILHGEQQFEYREMVYAGDTLTFHRKITNIYDKKCGVLEFVVKQSEVTNQRGASVATLTSTIVVRHPEGAA